MKELSLLIALIVFFISSAEQCGSKSEVSPDNSNTGCFANSPLTTISWAKDQLAQFQKPKSGPLQVVVYTYRDEQFLAFENAFVSSPMSYIFDCLGRTISTRGINYNEFYNNNKKLSVLLEGTY